MTSVLVTVALAVFATTLFVRSVDPLVLQIAAGVGVSPTTAALLSTAFALPYALMQPVLGALADSLGKARIMVVCLAIGTLATLASAVANDFAMLAATRVIAGIAAGGVFPTSVAIIGDLVPMAGRQIAISRVLAAGMLGNLLGASLSGIVGDMFGWRSVFLVTGTIAALMFVPSLRLLRHAATEVRTPLQFSLAVSRYRGIFQNPLAKYCFGAVFLDALVLFGLFPYMGSLLHAQGETRASIVGIIIAGWGVGGIFYAVLVGRLLPRFGDRALMIDGGALMGVALLIVASQPAWQIQFFTFVLLGFGFYLMHGGIQVYVTELSTTARSSALALHSSSFFFGQAAGPVVYGLGFAHLGTAWTMVIAALSMAALGTGCAFALRRPT
ncbi:MAG: MFS transporter [Rhizobiales bacterium]|nr:MFS transporter [Hyphomicrobiales bacterium]